MIRSDIEVDARIRNNNVSRFMFMSLFIPLIFLSCLITPTTEVLCKVEANLYDNIDIQYIANRNSFFRKLALKV